jgi:hypothetical protein
MRKTTKIISIAGIISAASLALVVVMLQYSQSGVAAPDTCLPTSLSAIPAKDFPIREPRTETVSSNASLRAIDENKDLVTMYYADFSMCPFDETPEAMIQKGAVKVTIFKPQATFKDSADFQQQELDYYTSNPDIVAKVQPIEVNGYNGVGWEPYEGKSVVRLNGEEIESTPVSEPGVVRFYNEQDGTIYFITANRPLDGILEIARSIQ